MMATVSWQPNAPGDLHRSYIKRYWQSLIRHTHGFYTNEADDDNQSQWSGNYQGNHARLVAIKRRYDPDNIFRLNANVLPG